MQVLLRGPLLTNSGYGVHSRQLFEWLYKRDDVELTVECTNWGRTSWILNTEQDNGIIGKIMSKSRPLSKGNYDYSFQVQLPDEWDPTLAKKNIGITAAVETDKCSEKWIECCNKMDHIVVPSEFTKNVLLNSGDIKKEISVIHEWFDGKIVNNKSLITKTLNDERFSVINEKFNILIVGLLTSQNLEDDRKNLLNTIKWCCEEFKGNENVGIVLKTSCGKGTSIDKKMTLDFLNNNIKSIRKSEFPKIHLVHGNMKNEEILSMYQHNKIKAFAIATRGEGYGLPILESAASGLPIVTTNWSGHLDFLEKDNFYPVEYELKEINNSKIDNRIFIKGSKWANPLEQSFKSQIRKVYEEYDVAKEKAKKMQKNILINFNSSIIMKKYDKILNGDNK